VLLRQEAETAIERHGVTDKNLNELPLQDSFMREINKLHSPFASAFSFRFLVSIMLAPHCWSIMPLSKQAFCSWETKKYIN
jgi:hypothetical protein